MSIEQTNQLILLILNSVLMMLLSASLLGGAWLRQNMLSQQLQQIRLSYRLMTQDSGLSQANLQAKLKKNRSDRQRLSQQYRWSHIGMLTLHMALLVFSVSLFALALRSLLSFDGLISTALFLFTLGAAGLLAGVGCILVDLWQGNGSLDSLGDSGEKTLGDALGKALAKLFPKRIEKIGQLESKWNKKKRPPIQT
jgi:hypothetical protein